MDDGMNGNMWDISYDSKIEAIEGIQRLPWVGKNYSSQAVKTLILGESVYDWNPKDSNSSSIIGSPNNLRQLHANHAMNFKRKSKFVRNIERAIFNKRNPKDSEKEMLWEAVVYHNLVSRVLKNKKHRPTSDDYDSGWATFDSLDDTLLPDQVIVYGLEKEKIKSFLKYCHDNDLDAKYNKLTNKVGRSFPRVAVLTKGDRKVKFLFIRHPSSYFSWKGWAPVIGSNMVSIVSR